MATIESATALVRKFCPKYKLIDKQTSRFHKLIGAILFFTPYMKGMWTTIGYTTAYPSIGPGDYKVIYHEGRHVYQSQKYGRLVMSLLYLLPLSLLPVFIAAVVASYHYDSRLAAASGILGALCLAPLPSYFRMKFEYQAYEISLAVEYWTDGHISDSTLDSYCRYFTGPDYYYMWPFKNNMMNRLRASRLRILSDDILKDKYAKAVYDDIVDSAKNSNWPSRWVRR